MTTSNRPNQYLRRAVRHEARARNYRRQADLLLQRDSDTDCAGALLYEAAKQCINAVANQRGENPGTTGGKVNVVREVAAEEPNGTVLFTNWQSADKLHIHADREHLTNFQYDEAWQKAQEFIDAMLTIYDRSA